MTIKHFGLLVLLVVIPVTLAAQQLGGLDPASLAQPLEDSWPTYSGDYTGRRYSRLTQVTTETVQHLTLAWTREIDASVSQLDVANASGAGGTTVGVRAPASSSSASQASKEPCFRSTVCST